MRSPSPLVALGVLAVTSSAAASGVPESIVIQWQAPKGCPGQDVFEAELAEQLTPAVRASMRDQLIVTVEIRAGPSSDYELTVTTPVGRRDLSDRSCTELVKTAAFIVAMSIDVTASNPPGGSGVSPNDGEPAEIRQAYDLESPYGGTVKPELETPPNVTRDTPIKIVRERPPIYLAMRATLGGDIGVLPHPAPAVGIGMAVVRERFRLEVTGSTSQAQPAATVDKPSIGAELSLWTAGIRGCYEVAPGVISGALCAGGETGRFRIDAFGIVPGTELERDGPWWAGSTSVALERRLWGPLSARVEAGMVARLVSTVFTVSPPNDDPSVSIHKVPFISARVMSGLEVRFR